MAAEDYAHARDELAAANAALHHAARENQRARAVGDDPPFERSQILEMEKRVARARDALDEAGRR